MHTMYILDTWDVASDINFGNFCTRNCIHSCGFGIKKKPGPFLNAKYTVGNKFLQIL